ncbi:IS1/IS1595 family N-terminal zinc-binding domain-containing protein [Roseofilum capinflatum]|uniref:IS1/IS1595 family N-terminal zinc-binding domain-containing protein n=1 Tax=Roseofilum capinflatum TaxID=3082943 RepID=UPI003D2F9A99
MDRDKFGRFLPSDEEKRTVKLTLTKSTYEQLRAKAEEEGLHLAVMCRDILIDWLQRSSKTRGGRGAIDGDRNDKKRNDSVIIPGLICSSCGLEAVRKNGHTQYGKQRYICTNCGSRSQPKSM